MQKRSTYLISLSLIILCIFNITMLAQSPKIKKLDSLFDALENYNKAMGSIIISEKGQIIYSRAIGYRYVNNQEKLKSNVDTKYRIGSISKMFTSTIIFKLIEENKIKLSTTLDQFYPEIPNSKSITIKALLGHRSGIHSLTNDTNYREWMTKPKTHEEIIKIISSYASDFEPNSQYSYSNSNFILLGYIIEKIENKSYSEVLEDKIISRLHLSNTYYGKKTDPSANEAFSYSFDNKTWVQELETDLSIPHGAGAIVSNPKDLVKFIEALFNYQIINQSSLETMISMVDGHGLGIMEFPLGTIQSYGHDGSIDGFTSMLSYFPDSGMALAYCANGGDYTMNSVLLGVLSIYFDLGYTIPNFKRLILQAKDLEKYQGEYSSADIPLVINVRIINSRLTAQANGQPPLPLEASENDIFRFDPAGIVMEFHPDKNEFILKQGGGTFTFTKKK